jgi:hypothetical protein
VLVAAGSGGTADQVAAAVRGDETLERARALVDSELVRAVDLSKGAERALTAEVERIFSEGS